MVEDPSTFGSFTLQDRFLFKGNKLCIFKGPLRGIVIKAAHTGALAGNFSINKTLQTQETFLFAQRVGMYIR